MQLHKKYMPLIPKSAARRSVRGFSLLELAVVIAVTTTLAALLLPALSSAKERSRRAVCRNNMRQFSTTCYLYGSDNDDFFPSGFNNLGNVMSMMVSDETYSNLVSYAGNPGVLDCPNIYISSYSRTNTFQRGVRIGFNYLAGVDPRSISKVKVTALKPIPLRLTDAGTNILMADANIWTDTGTQLKIAPHTDNGPLVQNNTSATTGSSGSYSDLDVAGGNIALLDLSVTWKPISAMNEYKVSVDAGQSSPLTCSARW